MTSSDHGRIAARALGILFAVFGLVTLIDFAIHLDHTEEALNEMGWTDFGSPEENEDQGGFSTFFHDTYYVVTPSVSPIASAGFILIGIGFFVFSPSLGRLIGGASSGQERGEQGSAGEPATRSESDSEGDDKPQPESEGRSR